MVSNTPKFLCIGVQKAATSWLSANLREHPNVWMPPVKELHYFSSLDLPKYRGAAYRLIRAQLSSLIWERFIEKRGSSDDPYRQYLESLLDNEMFTEEWYKRIYSLPETNGKMTGEVTPDYCEISEKGVEYVREFLGNIKIIIIARDPVDRALSSIRMHAKFQKINLQRASLDQWMKLTTEPDAINARLHERARYSEFIPLWKNAFGEENVLILQYTLVADQPRKAIRTIERFLKLPPHRYRNLNRKVHESNYNQIQPPNEVIMYLQDQLAAETRFFEQL
jgi:hypothetical protein